MKLDKFNYDKVQTEEIFCNLCNKNNFFVLAKKADSGLPVQACLCRNCGLIYINPRMAKHEYDKYYKHFYRDDRAKIKKKIKSNVDAEKIFEHSKRFGAALAHRLKNYILEGLTLDVGSDNGAVLAGLKDTLPALEVIGIEPSVKASCFANNKGIKTYNCLFENFNEDVGSFSNIFCVKSLNHLLNPRNFFLWSYNQLKTEGRLVLVVKNFRHQCRRGGSVESGVQLDHCYMFTPETLKFFVQSVGFKIIYFSADEDKTKAELKIQRKQGLHKGHICLVAIKPKDGFNKLKLDSNRKAYFKLRLQLFNPFVKIYYYIFYANKAKFLKDKLNLKTINL